MRLSEPADPGFTRRFLAALPPDVAASFTPTQLAAVQRCFGLRHAGRHAIDLRRSLWTPFGRIYLVVLAGRERRAGWPAALLRLGRAGLAAGATLAGLGVALAGLVLMKRALGIDLIPGIDGLPDETLLAWLAG